MKTTEDRTHTLALRVARWMFWSLRDHAHDRGMQGGTFAYWVLRAALEECADEDQATIDAWITTRLPDALAEKYRAAVEKGLDRLDKGEIPF